MLREGELFLFYWNLWFTVNYIRIIKCFVYILFISKVPIDWEPVNVTPIIKNGRTVIPDGAINSVKKNTIALKGRININS